MNEFCVHRTLRTSASGQKITVREFHKVEYAAMQAYMQETVLAKNNNSDSELWILQHQPVYTLGIACTHTPILPTDIPVVQSDRGGQITYHGPGQLVVYPILNLRQFNLGIKSLVGRIHTIVQACLDEYSIESHLKDGAPGVYVNEAKIAALGLRIKNGYSYHGVSLNVSMDLSPFTIIDPCGYQGLKAVNMCDFDGALALDQVKEVLLEQCLKQL